MFEPEIARRCSSCGASVRQRASFCPQCGQVVVKQQPDSQADSQTTPVEGPETQIIGAPSEGYETQILVAPPEVPIAPEVPEANDATETDPAQEELRSHPFPMVAETQPLITQTIQREPTVSEADNMTPHAINVARPGKEHHLMDRVDRIRKVSSVVIDQAAYDPSLRFLLVAAVLFILFVILMVLSKVIG